MGKQYQQDDWDLGLEQVAVEQQYSFMMLLITLLLCKIEAFFISKVLNNGCRLPCWKTYIQKHCLLELQHSF